MSVRVANTGLLSIRQTTFQQVRYVRNRLNLQRPLPMHFKKLQFLKVCEPIYPEDLRQPSEKCLVKTQVAPKAELSPLDKIYAGEIRSWFQESKLSAICAPCYMTYDELLLIRIQLFKNDMKYVVRKNATFKLAITGTEFENLAPLFYGPTAAIFCPEAKVKELLKILKKAPKLPLLAAVVDGRIMSVSQLRAYAQLPDLEGVRSQLVQTLDSGSQGMVQKLGAHQQILMQQLSQRIDQLKSPESSTQCDSNSPTSKESESVLSAKPQDAAVTSEKSAKKDLDSTTKK